MGLNSRPSRRFAPANTTARQFSQHLSYTLCGTASLAGYARGEAWQSFHGQRYHCLAFNACCNHCLSALLQHLQDVPMVKPGDASMASPFTAKAASVAPVTDILKQGRCTLVTTVQMFKILGLLCLSTAYALSVMYLQGVKLSDAQVS
jgi:hypothetical protein